MFDNKFDYIVVGVLLSAVVAWLAFLVWLISLLFDYV